MLCSPIRYEELKKKIKTNPANGKPFYSCLKLGELKTLITSLSVTGVTGVKDKMVLWNALDKWHVENKRCKAGEEWLWVGRSDQNQELKAIARRSFRPPKPEAWIEKPDTWLSNFNIDDVMVQYEAVEKNHFKYFGALPSDFYKPNVCQDGLCNMSSPMSLATLLKQKKWNLGLIVNFDKTGESGSHWTAIFACLNVRHKMYGIYFYNSTTGVPPNDIEQWLQQLKLEVNKVNKKQIVIHRNTIQHQFKNTECGMFSINFLAWALKAYKQRSGARTFDGIIQMRFKDCDMLKMRDEFFRPPSP